MFKELRNKFLILNMTIISIVMIVSFMIIYLSTYNTIRNKNITKLDSLPIDIRGTIIDGDRNILNRIIPSDFSLSFTITLDNNGNILEIISYIDMPEEVYQRFANAAFENQKEYATLKYDGKKWMYKQKQIKKMLFGHNNLLNNDNIIHISFLDITDSTATLTRLLITLITVGLSMLLVIYLISTYFANKAIEPIIKIWDKQKQFVADASHELKTPITIINANTEALLLNEKDTIKKQKKWLNYIKDETERMSKLVNNLLYLARNEDNELKLQNIPFDISNILTGTILSMETIIFEKNIKLIQNIEPNLIIKGDSDKLKQVFIILLDNAFKYTDSLGKINITLKKNNKHIILEIENTGKGIPEKELSKVFDRFYRIDTARTNINNSYGLGLSIAKTIIERMNGKITVKSIENKSTTFTILLKSK